jgi:hypothetical protein
VTLVLLVAALAVAGLLLSGRGLSGLPALRVRAVRLLVAAAAVQIAVGLWVPEGGWPRATATVLTVLLVALFLVGNAALPGVPLVAAGLLLNAVVVGLNAGMPVSVDAARRAGVPVGDLRLDRDPMREPVGGGTRLAFLGDTIPVALPWRPQAVSPGDLLVAAGVGLLLVAGAGGHGRRPRRGPGGQPRRTPTAAPARSERPTAVDRESTTRGSYS